MHNKKTNKIIFPLEVSIKYSRSLYKTPFKIKKIIWYGKLADSDPFTPSCPHLHSLNEKYKLNVYTGEIYEIQNKKKLKNKYVRESELSKLWSDLGFLQFANKMRDIYKKRYPNSDLPSIPIYTSKNTHNHLSTFWMKAIANPIHYKSALNRKIMKILHVSHRL